MIIDKACVSFLMCDKLHYYGIMKYDVWLLINSKVSQISLF